MSQSQISQNRRRTEDGGHEKIEGPTQGAPKGAKTLRHEEKLVLLRIFKDQRYL